jgi:hypothetical protein
MLHPSSDIAWRCKIPGLNVNENIGRVPSKLANA